MNNIGKITLDLPPGPGNPRNSEGAFYTLNDGSILFIYSKYTGDSHKDDGYSCIAQRVSTDMGETWSDDTILFKAEDHSAINIMSVSLLKMQNGDIGLFYAVRQGWHDNRLHIRRSSNQGKTWSDASACLPCPGYFVTNNDRVVRLSTGRILLPANFHRMRGLDKIDWQSFDSRGIPCMFYSDDDGYTWQEGIGYCFTTLPNSRSGFQESGVIEMESGAIWQWMRTDMGCQYQSFSLDGGETWSAPSPSQFTGPCSPLSIKQIPNTKTLLAVWNPIPNYNGRNIIKISNGRTPLVMAISHNEGATWSEHLVLEDEPDHGYCYTAIHFVEDAVLLSYCAGGPEDVSLLSRLRIKKVSLNLLP